jgi:transposase
MKKRSIYGQQSQALMRIYEEAGRSSKVLVGAIDYAKRDHVAMLCNGNGDILKKPFPVKNTPEGVDFLLAELAATSRYHKIDIRHAYFGGEDCGSYTENFAQCLRDHGFLVANVNAEEAKQQRENMQASTDRLDLLGIARMLINRRGNCSPSQSGPYRNMRTLMRHRRKLVRLSTEQRNRMHCLVDRLFPGYLEAKNSGLTPFDPPSLRLMEDHFSAQQIARRKRTTLAGLISRAGGQNAEPVAAKLQEYAATVLHAAPEYVPTLQMSLAQHVALYRCLSDSIDMIEREIAVWLAQTQGAFLMSVRGIGMVLAAGVAAEIGDPSTQRPANYLASYAGIIPRVAQTGGPDAQAFIGKVAHRCNRILKDYLVQSGAHLGLHGVADLMADHHRRDAAGQHANYGIARRYLRMGMHLMRNSTVYLPPELRSAEVPTANRGEYYQVLWPYLLGKWKKYNAHHVAFAPANPLGQWRNMVQELYGIKLHIPGANAPGGN